MEDPDGSRYYQRGAFFANRDEFNYVLNRRFPNAQCFIDLAGIPIPPACENLHTLISAGTGAGKSVTISNILKSIRARGDRAIILDCNGEFYNAFHQAGDIKFSPFSEDFHGWTLGGEIRSPIDWDRYAETLIPQLKGSGEEWQAMARALLSAVGKSLMALDGKATNKDLIRLLTVVDIDELAPFLEGTPAAMLVAKDDKSTTRLQSIRLSFLSALQGLSNMKDGDFSFRKWVRNRNNDDGNWLFIPYTDHELGLTKSLLALWTYIIVMAALENPNSSKTTWLIIDELDSLGAVPALVVGAARLRKSGFAILSAVQDYAQLRHTYGDHRAATLINNFSNKLIMRTADPQACEDLSKAIGEQEYTEKRISFSSGTSGDNTTSSSTDSYHTMKDRLVLPEEIAQLPVGVGYLKFAGEWPVLKVQSSI